MDPYHDKLPRDPDPIYLPMLRVFREHPVAHEGIVLVVFHIVDIQHEGVVRILRLEYLVGLQVLHEEGDLAECDLLVQPLPQLHLLHVVLLVRRVEHGRHVVHVTLLVDADVDSDGTSGQGVNLERDLELIVRSYVLFIHY